MGQVKVFRCRICGDPYIGAEAPKQCPFCGAAQRFFVEAQDWNPDEFNVTLSEVSKKNLEAALQLELDNAAFYNCAKGVADKAGDHYGLAKFKCLMKVEKEQKCSECTYLTYCVGCVLAAYIFKGNLQCYDPYSCVLYRAYDEVIGLME